jgi:hypothetical protein
MSAGTDAARIAAPRARVAERLSAGGVSASLGRCLGTALLEIRLNLFSATPWVIGLILSALGYLAVRTAPDASSFPLGWVLSHEIGPLAAVLLLFLAASLAHRPQRYEVAELHDSKRVASEELILGRWIGMVVTLLVLLALQYAVTMVGQKIHAKPPVLPLAYLQSLARLLPSVLFLATLSFCLVAATRVLVLGAGLAGLVWFILYSGQTYFGSVFRIELSQNAPVFLGLTATVLLVMLLTYRGRRRAKHAPATFVLALGVALVFLMTGLFAAWASLALPGKARAVASWKRLQDARRSKDDPLPNFAWVSLSGERASLASLRGKPALVVFFQPKDGGLVALLRRLSALHQELEPKGLGVLAVCLSEDLNGARHAAQLAGAGFPIVTDWGRPAASGFDRRQPPSVVSWALQVSTTPLALLVDAEGREKARGLPLDEASWPALKTRLRGALNGEDPELPVPDGILEGLAP